MHKHALLTLISFLLLALSTVQGQWDTTWVKTYGGSGTENVGSSGPKFYGTATTGIDYYPSDSGLIVVSATNSKDGDVRSTFYAGHNIWIYRLNKNGDTLWTKILAGDSDERSSDVLATSDGGYVITGYTNSTNGDFRANPVRNGNTSGFAARYDKNGSRVWMTFFSSCFFLTSITQLEDGNYAVTGNFANSQNTDAYLAKISSNSGAIQWQLTVKGTRIHPDQLEEFYEVKEDTATGDLYAIGNSGDAFITSIADVLLAKVDENGKLIWNKTYGSSTNWDAGSSLEVMSGTGVYFAAAVGPGPAGASRHLGGNFDGWLVKTDTAGIVQWEKTYGGSDIDVFHKVLLADDTALVAMGYRRDSLNDPKTYDFYLVKASAQNGDSLASMKIGGNGVDILIDAVFDDKYENIYIKGRTASTDTFLAGTKGDRDDVVIKFEYKKPTVTGLPLMEDKQVASVYPIPFQDRLQIDLGYEAMVRLYTTTGHLVKEQLIEREGVLKVKSSLYSGLYILMWEDPSGRQLSKKVIKN